MPDALLRKIRYIDWLMISFLLFCIGLVACVYLTVAVFIFVNQRRLQYNPSRRDVTGEGGADFEALRDDLGQFLGYWRPAEKPRRVVICFHGNGGEAIDRAWLTEIVPPQDILVLAEYPGYGARPGAPTQKSLFQSAEQLVDLAVKRWNAPITVVGESLGSGVAIYIASRKPIARLALISPFDSGIEIAKFRYPWLPVGLLMKDKFPSVEYARQCKVPMRIVHGTMDETVPIASGKKLFEAYKGEDKKFCEIPGFGHANLPDAIVDSPFSESFREVFN